MTKRREDIPNDVQEIMRILASVFGNAQIPVVFVGDDYPATVEEVLDDNMKFKKSTLEALASYKKSKPWAGKFHEKQFKLANLHLALCEIYKVSIVLDFNGMQEDAVESGESCYAPDSEAIFLRGKFSIVTYLHEFAHALGRGERGACKWSLNLFRKIFPKQFSIAKRQGHMLRGK